MGTVQTRTGIPPEYGKKPLRVSVVIPVLNAAASLKAIMDRLVLQEPSGPDEIIVVDSHSTDDTLAIASANPLVKIVTVDRFSHGRARNMGVREATGDVMVFMTQDALPFDNAWLANLVRPLAEGKAAAVYSRQVPYGNASPMEKYFLLSHFPNGEPEFRTRRDGEVLTFGRVFFSNVSAAATRQALEEHPYDETLIMSEDQQFCRDILNQGGTVGYIPASVVIHSHDYSLRQVFMRYLDSVHAVTEIFPEHRIGVSVSIGLKYLLKECQFVARDCPWNIPYYFLYLIAKAGGTIAGHFVGHMPRCLARRLSLHGYHWSDSGKSTSSDGVRRSTVSEGIPATGREPTTRVKAPGPIAVVRGVPDTYGKCIRSSEPEVAIDVGRARDQHRVYCETIEGLGFTILEMAADDRFPDCCFVEDTAIVVGATAFISRMAAPPRSGEELEVAVMLKDYMAVREMNHPAMIDGGDVLQVDGRTIYVGISERTNRDAVDQLRSCLPADKYRVVPVAIRNVLHLKTACTYIGNGCMVMIEGCFDTSVFAKYRKIIAPAEEAYCANCLALGGKVMVPEGYPRTRNMIEREGFETIALDMSEFRKGDGSLTCLSIPFGVGSFLQT